MRCVGGRRPRSALPFQKAQSARPSCGCKKGSAPCATATPERPRMASRLACERRPRNPCGTPPRRNATAWPRTCGTYRSIRSSRRMRRRRRRVRSRVARAASLRPPERACLTRSTPPAAGAASGRRSPVLVLIEAGDLAVENGCPATECGAHVAHKPIESREASAGIAVDRSVAEATHDDAAETVDLELNGPLATLRRGEAPARARWDGRRAALRLCRRSDARCETAACTAARELDSALMVITPRA